MGLISMQKVVSRAEYYGRRPTLQAGNREWVTAIESICADGYSLPPCCYDLSDMRLFPY